MIRYKILHLSLPVADRALGLMPLSNDGGNHEGGDAGGGHAGRGGRGDLGHRLMRTPSRRRRLRRMPRSGAAARCVFYVAHAHAHAHVHTTAHDIPLCVSTAVIAHPFRM